MIVIQKCLALCQVVLITWGCSGTHVEFMFPMFIISLLMYIITIFFTKEPLNEFEKVLSIVLFLTICICLVQYLNPSMERVNAENYVFFRSIDYIKWLPTSIRSDFITGNSLRALVEISTVLTSTFAFLHLFKDREFLKVTLSFFGVNAALMGLYGIWQQMENIPIIYNTFHSSSQFFGSFYLSNAAGAFLNLGIVANLAMICVFLRRKNIVEKLYALLPLLCSLVCSYASFKTGSNASFFLMLATWAICISLLFIIFIYNRISSKFALVVFIVFLFLSFFVVWYYLPADKNIYNLSSNTEYKVGSVERSISERVKMYNLCKRIIEKNFIYGVGGGACQYVLSLDMLKNQDLLLKRGASTEHAHSDIIEYVIDFGIIGFLLIFVCFISWIRCFLRSNPTEESFILLIGVFISLFHSCFDMNLHIMSTMITCALIVSATVSMGKKGEI